MRSPVRARESRVAPTRVRERETIRAAGRVRSACTRWAVLAPLCSVVVLALACAMLPGGGGPTHTPAWQLPPPPPKLAPVVRPGALTRVELENGLELLVLEDHRLPKLSLGLTVRRGAGSVDPASAGLAQFTAELMNRGAGDRDALALAEAVDDIGASLSVSAGWDSMQVSISGLSRDLDTLVDILRDVALTPRLDEMEAEKTRAEQLAGLEGAKDSPETLVRWHVLALLYPGHRYGLPVDGTPESVAKLDAAAARALYAAYFVPNNAILYATGDIDADAWVERARRVFGSWSRGPLPASTPPPPSPTPTARRIVIVDEPDLVQTRIVIAHEGLDRRDPRRIAAGLMNDTLGGSGFSSRLMATLRSDEGLTYGVGSGFALRRRPGPFLVSTFTRVPETRRAVDILLAEIEAIRGDRPQSEDELAKSKSYNVGRFGLGLETSAAVMGSLVDLAVYGLPEDSLDTYRARVQAVTAEEVAAVARDLLHPERAGIILLGPAEVLVPQLESLGEVVVVQP